MKGVTLWSFAPYKPLTFDVGSIYVCRIIPSKNEILLEWLDARVDEYVVEYRRAGDEAFLFGGETKDTSFCITNLEEHALYEVRVTEKDGEKSSRVRYARTGRVEGTVVNYLAPEDNAYSYSGKFLCSPSLLRHPDGFLLASMDVYKMHAPQNLSFVFRSDDDGRTWKYQCELYPCFWGKMFLIGKRVYMLSVNTEYGDLQIGYSDDGGNSFCAPVALLRGSAGTSNARQAGVHKNPQPVVEYGGRLWFTMEWGSWGIGKHDAMVGSIAVGDDPMNPANWSFSEPLAYDPAWEGCAVGPSAGNIEGTLVIEPDGKLYNYMRYDMKRCEPKYGKILRYEVNTNDPEAPLIYRSAVDFDGNHSKFTIKYDEASGYYYSIMDRITCDERISHRDLLSLVCSRDAHSWELVCDLIDRRGENPEKIGFQYVDFLFDGEDLIWLCRTADNMAGSFHDSNYITFHRISDFRTLLSKK